MAQEVKVIGRIRQTLQAVDRGAPGDEESIALSEQYAQLVSLDSSPYGELVKIGRAFRVGTTAAIAAVAAVPTTAVMLAIYNGEDDGGKSLVIDRAWATAVAHTAATSPHMVGIVGSVREALPVDAALNVRKQNGNGTSKDTRVRTILNATALPATTGIAGDWFPIGPSSPLATAAFAGGAVGGELNGRIIVPPGRYFGIHVVSAVTDTFLAGIEWHEKLLTLG